eukprot:jgi/Bigna1/68373/fgenesh1_pg.6_\
MRPIIFLTLQLSCGLASLPPEFTGAEIASTLSRSAFLRGLATVGGAAAAFRGAARVSVIGHPRIPPIPPSSKHEVIGEKIIRVGAGPESCRARVFYPATSSLNSDSSVSPYLTDGKATSDGMASLVGFDRLGLSFLLEHLSSAKSGGTTNAVPNYDTAFPLLVYSHGFGGNMDMAASLLRQIASEGIVVLALEHTDGTASRTVLADGSERKFQPTLFSREQQLLRRSEELLVGSQPSSFPPELRRMIDWDSVFLGGHSYGGPSALLALERSKKLEITGGNDVGIRGLILHDPALGRMTDSPTGAQDSVPIVSFTSDEYDRYGVRCGSTFHCRGAFHGNFVDAPLWAPSWVMRPLSKIIPAAGPADPVLLHRELAEAARKFVASVRRGKTRSDEASATIIENTADAMTFESRKI